MVLIEKNIPLSPLCSFRVGGIARLYAAPEDTEALLDILEWANRNGEQVFVLGRGTNIVFADSGFDGLVIHLGKSMTQVSWGGETVTAHAGAGLNSLVVQSVRMGLDGIQKLAGIPGTVGGGIYINAGAFGRELGDTALKVHSCTADGQMIERAAADCDFGYRHSRFCNSEEIVIQAELRLFKGNQAQLQKELEDILQKRKLKQPLQYPSAGSMFKRPANDYAGRLIEAAGLKGKTRGGAQVSDKHANFIINLGTATSRDIFDLSEEVIEAVHLHSGITLEREVRFIGNFRSAGSQ